MLLKSIPIDIALRERLELAKTGVNSYSTILPNPDDARYLPSALNCHSAEAMPSDCSGSVCGGSVWTCEISNKLLAQIAYQSRDVGDMDHSVVSEAIEIP